MIKLSNGDYVNPRCVVSIESAENAFELVIYLNDQHEIKMRFESGKLRDKEVHRLISLIEGRFSGMPKLPKYHR